ncbi:septal ring lytic transglycosylase RlpA family protein [Candidatus Peregrinibacteria bacterium]|nr:MAG: septal ring lytic transglycosylase RlpA family protein [Candidatus Peregrinibacteria bacterium]
MKSPFFIIGIALSLLFSPAVASGAPEFWYTDLHENNEYYTAIYTLTDQGTLSGYEDGSFQALKEVNRVEALKMILVSTGHSEELTHAERAPFSDLEEDSWYVPYVNYAYEAGFISGDPEGTFRPQDTVNRAEALKMLINAADDRSQLPTIENDTWYTAYLDYAIEHAFLIPNANGDYTPEALLSRGELAELIYRFQSHPYTGEVEYGDATYYGYSFDGANTASGTALDAYGYMAAHKTLPFGTRVRITNIWNHTSVIVTIVDRGPYGPGRIIDLTPAAFEELGALSTGVLDVRLEVLAE